MEHAKVDVSLSLLANMNVKTSEPQVKVTWHTCRMLGATLSRNNVSCVWCQVSTVHPEAETPAQGLRSGHLQKSNRELEQYEFLKFVILQTVLPLTSEDVGEGSKKLHEACASSMFELNTLVGVLRSTLVGVPMLPCRPCMARNS